MSNGEISMEERRRIRWARLGVYSLPVIAGFITIGTAVLHDVIGLPGGPHVGDASLIGNALLAGFGSAYLVARLHPVEQGTWVKGVLSFLISFLMAWMATVLLVRLAARFNLM